MSEHMSIKGDIEFWHLPYEEKGSFSFCHRCNSKLSKLRLNLHQGISDDWIEAECPKCKKKIWVAQLTSDEEDFPKTRGGRFLVENNEKCAICKTPTNRFDAACYVFQVGKKAKKKGDYLCSEKCSKAYDKRRKKKR